VTLSKLILTSGGMVALALAGCGTTLLSHSQREAVESGCVPAGQVHPLWKASAEIQRCIDDKKCRQLGFKPGTESYGNCRLQLEQIRATRAAAAAADDDDDAVQARRKRNAAVEPTALGNGRKVYDASECIGPVIMGECKGSILPDKAYHPTCHGEWINGQCTGPMF
jgi:hypothetical protein